MSDLIKPCPFCGCNEQFIERYDEVSCYVQCDGVNDDGLACLCRGPVRIQDGDGEELPGSDSAITAWNTRQEKEA